MNGFKQIAPISELPRKYLELLRKASYTNEPVILFRRNKPVGGLVDYQLLQSFMEAKQKLEVAEALGMVKEAKAAYQEKKTKVLKNPRDLWKPWAKTK